MDVKSKNLRIYAAKMLSKATGKPIKSSLETLKEADRLAYIEANEEAAVDTLKN